MGQKFESGLSAVSLRPCGPLALIPVSGKKNEIGAKFRPKNDCSVRPWGRWAVTLVSESCILVNHTGHSASVLRDSAVYSQKYFFLNITPPQKTPKQIGVFMGFPGTFARLKSRLSQMVGNQVIYGPNGPGNEAPGRSASMPTRTASRGRYSAKFRSTCILGICTAGQTKNLHGFAHGPIELFLLAV
jgi:hypothetical protein